MPGFHFFEENLKICKFENLQTFNNLTVFLKFSSVSVGKPTIISAPNLIQFLLNYLLTYFNYCFSIMSTFHSF